MLHVFTSVILQLYRYTPQILKELGEGSDVCGWSLIIVQQAHDIVACSKRVCNWLSSEVPCHQAMDVSWQWQTRYDLPYWSYFQPVSGTGGRPTLFVYVDLGFVMLMFGKLLIFREKTFCLIFCSAAYLCKNFAYFLQPWCAKAFPIFESFAAMGRQKIPQCWKTLLSFC